MSRRGVNGFASTAPFELAGAEKVERRGGVTRDVQHGERGAESAQQPPQIVPVHARHPDVGDDQPNIGCILVLEDGQRLDAVPGLQQLMIEPGQRTGGDGAHQRVVDDDEYRGT